MIQVKTKNGQRFRGGLQSILADSIVLVAIKSVKFTRQEVPQGTTQISVNNISGLSLTRKSTFFKGAGWGFLAGFIPGSLLGLASGGIEEASAEEAAVAFGLFFGGIGAFIGGSIGALKGVDVDVSWEGKSAAEKKAILHRLGTGKYGSRKLFRVSPWAGSISPPFEKESTTIVG